jgi:succinate dehydrogenase / fumarate reductase membrane anchor subunit
MTTTTTTQPERVHIPKNFDQIAWTWMRYSAFLLIPLAWFHIILQDVIVNVHRIDLTYVQVRWSLVAWRVYDAALLAFAFAHGMNGVRQVARDYFHNPKTFQVVSIILFIGWLLITIIGSIALIGGARNPA